MKNSRKKPRKPSKHKGSFKKPSAVKREIDQLRDWANRKVNLELILSLAGGALSHRGTIRETRFGSISDFNFVTNNGIRISLVPQLFPKSSVEIIKGLGVGLYVEGKTKDDGLSFTIREHEIDARPNPNLKIVLAKLQTWAKLNLPLHVFVSQGLQVLSLLAEAKQLSSGLFCVMQSSGPTQLLFRVEEYKHVSIESKDGKTTVTLFDPNTGDYCMLSDGASTSETIFKQFAEISSKIH
jgi:hypothetical protein